MEGGEGEKNDKKEKRRMRKKKEEEKKGIKVVRSLYGQIIRS